MSEKAGWRFAAVLCAGAIVLAIIGGVLQGVGI